ncbi:MAG: Nif3-like dinuclear metal center hexameric protein [Chitinophagaceae bacterium]|nr:Nif3-like dinuclear metal center hexameric protein [Chitinophagaceae bacterium]
MVKIREIINLLEGMAPPQLQESYDNAGLLTGDTNWNCSGIIVSLDATESVVQEAIEKKCNLVVAHHPIIFSGLKKITGRSYVERTVIAAIKNDIAIYAIHTNLDNILAGVNGKIADILCLVNRQALLPQKNTLKKLVVFVPLSHAENVRNAILGSGAGNIGNYSECSFNTAGDGTFKAGEGTNPFSGIVGERHTAKEIKVEVIFQSWLEEAVLKAMQQAHPYEEVAYDMISLENTLAAAGSGLLGELPQPISELDFLALLKESFQLKVIKHTKLTGKKVKKVALCGGAGSFLTKAALGYGADFYVTSDVKYHEFFDAEDRLVVADIGHYESEQYTISLVFDILKQKYPTFAVLKTEINTNPVQYFL